MQDSRAYTLIEIMVVVAIIGLLAGLITPRNFIWFKDGQVEIARATCQQLHDDCRLVEIRRHRLVRELDALTKPLDKDTPALHPSVPDDPWGTAYWLERGDEGLRVYSAGPDAQQGSDDDICYPEPPGR